MIKGGKGGARTQSGLVFEDKVKIEEPIKELPGFDVIGNVVYRNGTPVAEIFYKKSLYSHFLEPRGVDYSKIISRRLEPDSALLVGKTLYIVEVKFQNVAGSVDEKLQTCHFKKRQYEKLCSPLGIRVEYVYVLSKWFENPDYADVRDYIRDVGCHYYFGELPLSFLGLVPKPIVAS